MPTLDLDDAGALRRAYVEDGMSLSVIAEMAGCSYATARHALLTHGIEIRRSGREPIEALRDKEWLESQIRDGRTAKELAAELGCAEGTVRGALQWAGLSSTTAHDRPPELDDAEYMRRVYDGEGRSVRSIADDLGCTKDAVLVALRQHGIAIRSRGRRARTATVAAPQFVPAPAAAPATGAGAFPPAAPVPGAVVAPESAVAPHPEAQEPPSPPVDGGISTEPETREPPSPPVKNAISTEPETQEPPSAPVDDTISTDPERGEPASPPIDDEAPQEDLEPAVLFARDAIDLAQRGATSAQGAPPDAPAAATDRRPPEGPPLVDPAGSIVRSTPAGNGVKPIPPHGDDFEPPIDSRLPRGRVDMEIEKIEKKTFTVSLRGYDRQEVEEFLRAVANDYRQVVQTAREAVNEARAQARAAEARPAPPLASQFEDIGGHVSAVLSSAAEAAEEIKATAEKEALAIRQRAREETEGMRRQAAEYLQEVDQRRAASEQEAAALVTQARAEATEIVAAAQQRAQRFEHEAHQRAATLERTARANVEAVLAEARRDYEHLRSVQQQCVDRLASVEFLAKHARDGLSESAGMSIDELL